MPHDHTAKACGCLNAVPTLAWCCPWHEAGHCLDADPPCTCQPSDEGHQPGCLRLHCWDTNLVLDIASVMRDDELERAARDGTGAFRVDPLFLEHIAILRLELVRRQTLH
jgi:hypothetical protein